MENTEDTHTKKERPFSFCWEGEWKCHNALIMRNQFHMLLEAILPPEEG